MDVQMPDGTIIQGVPDGTSQADLLARYKAMPAPPAQSSGTSLLNAVTNPVGTAANYLANGPLKPLMSGLWESINKPANGLQDAVAGGLDKLDIHAADPSPADMAARQQDAQSYAAMQQQHPLMTFMGENAPLAFMSPAGMAGMAALQPGSAQDRAINAAGAYAGGKAGQWAGNAMGRLFGGPASMSPTATMAEGGNKWGIPTTVGQNSSSPFVKTVESVVAQTPMGGAVTTGRNASFQGFNKAVGYTVGLNDATKLTPEVLGEAKQRIVNGIDEIADRSVLYANKPQFLNGLAQAQTEMESKLPVGSPDRALAQHWLDQIMANVGPDGTIPGQIYRTMRGNLGEAMQNSGNASSTLGALRDALTKGMDASLEGTPDFAAWKTLNNQYFNLKQIGNAAKSTPEGMLSPNRLLTQVNQAQKGARLGGGNDLAELAQWAQPRLPDQIPNSGTAQRAWVQNLMAHPVETIGGGAGLLYGAHELGASPEDVAGGALLPFLIGRGMAGAPVSAATKAVLQGVGGAGGALSVVQALRHFGATGAGM